MKSSNVTKFQSTNDIWSTFDDFDHAERTFFPMLGEEGEWKSGEKITQEQSKFSHYLSPYINYLHHKIHSLLHTSVKFC